MEYKLLRALSIVLQAGLIILLAMLASLLFLSCKPNAKQSTVKSNISLEAQKDLIEQRFHNEMQKHRLQTRTLCFKKQAEAQFNPS
jgi:hypothetical protein